VVDEIFVPPFATDYLSQTTYFPTELATDLYFLKKIKKHFATDGPSLICVGN